jgi:hypothetical protein
MWLRLPHSAFGQRLCLDRSVAFWKAPVVWTCKRVSTQIVTGKLVPTVATAAMYETTTSAKLIAIWNLYCL